jgi:hypothetical protein
MFLAGSTGVIGRELLPLLTERGNEVVALTRREEEVLRLKSAGVGPAVADVFDAEGMSSVMAKARPEVVVHELTSLPDVFDQGRIAEQFAANDRIRREGTRNLLSGAKAAGEDLSAEHRLRLQAGRFSCHDGIDSALRGRPRALGRERPSGEGVALRYGHFYGPRTYFAPDEQLGRQGEVATEGFS